MYRLDGETYIRGMARGINDRDCVIACVNYSTENSPKLVFVAKGGPI
jgi:hypothetical protein